MTQWRKQEAQALTRRVRTDRVQDERTGTSKNVHVVAFQGTFCGEKVLPAVSVSLTVLWHETFFPPSKMRPVSRYCSLGCAQMRITHQQNWEQFLGQVPEAFLIVIKQVVLIDEEYV